MRARRSDGAAVASSGGYGSHDDSDQRFGGRKVERVMTEVGAMYTDCEAFLTLIHGSTALP